MRFVFALLLLCARLSAATVYCSPAGGGSGADFNNLATLPNTTNYVRTNVYVVVGHASDYGSKTLSTPASGTSTITIRKANASQDSGVAGWSSTFESLPATFGTITVATPYWIVDGVTRTETNRMEAPAGYGIRVTGQIRSSSGDSQDASNSQFSYLDVGGTWSEAAWSEAVCDLGDSALYLVFNQHDITFTRCVFHNAGHNGALVMAHGSEDITFDHCDFYFGWGKATVASPNVGQDGHVVKYCRFWNASQLDQCVDVEGGGITTELGTYSYAGTTTGNLVYGCVFYGTASGGRNAIIQYGETSPGPDAVNCKVFNNTFVGFPENCVVGEIVLFGGSGNEARNNLFWDTEGTMSITANATSNNVDAVSDPFVDYANRDFRLAAATAAGFDNGAPYNTDPLGNTRGADGTLDVGAYEFDDGGEEPGGGSSATTINATNVNIQ